MATETGLYNTFIPSMMEAAPIIRSIRISNFWWREDAARKEGILLRYLVWAKFICSPDSRPVEVEPQEREVPILEASVRPGRFFPPTRSGEFCGLQREDAEAGPVRYTAPRGCQPRADRWRENSCSDSVLTVGLYAGPPCGHTWARLMVSRTRSRILQCHSYCRSRFASTARSGAPIKPQIVAHSEAPSGGCCAWWKPTPGLRRAGGRAR